MALLPDDELASIIRHRAAVDPDGSCLERGSERWTNAEFLRACTVLAERLAPPEPHDTRAVAVSATSSQHVPFLAWASILARVDLLLMTNHRSVDTLEVVTRPLHLREVYCDLPGIEDRRSVTSLDEVATLCHSARHAEGAATVSCIQPPQAPRNLVRPAALLFQTSGTEGAPKLVRCEHRAFAKVVRAMLAEGALAHAVGARVFLSQPLVHSYGLSSYFEYFAAGATVVLPSERSPLGPIGDLMTAGPEVDAIEGVPHFWGQFSKLSSKLRLPSLRHIGIGGGALDSGVMGAILDRVPAATMSVRYGLTETPSVVTHKTFRPPHDKTRWHSSGRPISAYQLEVRDEHGTVRPVGQEGEIVVTGDCVSSEGGVLATGDLGYIDALGELVVTGRRSAFIKRRGYRLSPEAIEAMARECDGIADCRAVGRDDQVILEVVYVADDAADGILTRLRARLPDLMVPDAVVAVDTIPRTFSGKIRRR